MGPIPRNIFPFPFTHFNHRKTIFEGDNARVMRGRRLFHSLVIPTRLSLSLLFSQHHTMISLKPLITPIYAPLFPEPEFFRNRRNGLSSFCKSTNSDKSDEDNPSPPPPPPPPPPADIRNQELLARIAMLQTQKVRLTDYLDERSEYLTQFAEEANAEIDEIGENALKELDEAGARIMESIESRMQAFEESMELNKLEIEESEKEVADFVGQVEKERNEGLFFKSLGETKPVDKVKAKEEAQKVSEVTKKNAGSVVRRNIYLVLMGLVAIGIADASISSTSDWRKVAVLGAILVGLLSQFVYEQSMLSEAGKTEQEQSKESKRE